MSIQEKHPLLLRKPNRGPYTLVLHGGAGTISKEHTTPEHRAAYQNALSQALLAVSSSSLVELVETLTQHRAIRSFTIMAML